MINEFSSEVVNEIGYYVYRLIDPRNGNTFYVGKGKGNRVFAHMSGALAYKGKEDKANKKIGLIQKILQDDLEVIHVIHRHGLDNKTALEVEAALIDAYPGLSNVKGGQYSGEYGPMNALQIETKYKAETIEEITEKCIIIKIKQWSIDRAIDEYSCDFSTAIYEAAREAWALSINRAKNADFVFAVLDGIVKAVYCDMQWHVSEKWAPRLAFHGTEAPEDIKAKYIGRRIPPEYRKRGVQSPCQYVNC